MSIIAGVVSRRNEVVPQSLRATLKQKISRDPREPRIEFEDKHAYILKVDHGVFGAPAFSVSHASGTAAMLVGEPLLTRPGGPYGRTDDLKLLQAQIDEQDWSGLGLATGIFALVNYDPASRRLTLATDKMGHRPVYYYAGTDYVVFATALRILEDLPEVPKRVDVLGVTETAGGLSYTCADRTQYADIKRLRAAQLAWFDGPQRRLEFYYDWRTAVRPEKINENDALHRSHDLFMAATRKRLRGEKVVAACLSGGLDSRSVVAGLRDAGVDVYTFNYYAVLHCQDQVFAAEFAKAIGTHHTAIELPIWESGTSFEQKIIAAWQDVTARDGVKDQRLSTLWTGDGGTVGLGFLSLEPPAVEFARQKRYAELLDFHRSGNPASTILKPTVARLMHQMMADYLRERMEWANCEDPARAFHLFSLLEQQRSDFRDHFEELDLHKLEFQSPFYDSDFIAANLSLPVDWFLGHKFYHKWLKLLSPAASSVPWQTYPDHEPCPLPIPDGLPTQWDATVMGMRSSLRKRNLMDAAGATLRSDMFPSAIIRKHQALLALWLYRTGMRNCESALSRLTHYHHYWAKAGGSYELNAVQRLAAERIGNRLPVQ